MVLTIAHLDHIPEHCSDDNLRALCQKCHLTYDAKHHAENARKTRMKKYDEEYLNSKIEAYGKAHPNGNKEDLALLAEMRGYETEE